MAAADQDRDQRELRFRDLYQANFRPVQGYAVNRLGAADDVPGRGRRGLHDRLAAPGRHPAAAGRPLWLYGTARRVIARRHRSAGRLRNLLGRLAAERYPRAAAGRGERSGHRSRCSRRWPTQGRRPGGTAACALGTAQLRRGRAGARLLTERRGDPGAQGEGTDAHAAWRGNRERPARRRHQAERSHRWILTPCSPRPPRPGTPPRRSGLPGRRPPLPARSRATTAGPASRHRRFALPALIGVAAAAVAAAVALALVPGPPAARATMAARAGQPSRPGRSSRSGTA